MATFNEKAYLDFEGLAAYDELIKKLIEKSNNSSSDALDAEISRAQASEQAIIDSLADLANGAVADNTAAIEALQALVGEENVSELVEKAISDLVDGAPEALDTLKEIADWIDNDETGTAALIDRVADLEQANEDLQAYVDSQDEALYNAIKSISNADIKSLFLTPVSLGEGQTVMEAIASLGEDEKLVLAPDTEVAENLVISKDCVIEANGVTFTGNVSVAKDAAVSIIGANFDGPVSVQ